MNTLDVFRVIKWAAEHKELIPEPTEIYQLEKMADDCWRDILREDKQLSLFEKLARSDNHE